MHDIVFAAAALFGVVVVAISGHKFMVRDDERFERIALGVTPAVYSDAIADEVVSR
jgi:hypothetical protein